MQPPQVLCKVVEKNEAGLLSPDSESSPTIAMQTRKPLHPIVEHRRPFL